MNPKILRIEELAINALPAILTEVYDGWILRYSNGYTYRGNSVNPLYNSTIDLDEKIKICENKFFCKGLPCVFKMTESVEIGLDNLLESRQYEIEKKADIMEMPLAGMTFAELDNVIVESSATEKWLDDFVVLNGTEKEPMKSTAKTMLRLIGNPIFCVGIFQDGEMTACGLGVLEDGQIGLYDIRVLEQFRRKGLGTMICKKIIQEGIDRGAHTAYLQVASSNDIGIKMYEKIGFKKMYTYWYRVKSNSDVGKIKE